MYVLFKTTTGSFASWVSKDSSCVSRGAGATKWVQCGDGDSTVHPDPQHGDRTLEGAQAGQGACRSALFKTARDKGNTRFGLYFSSFGGEWSACLYTSVWTVLLLSGSRGCLCLFSSFLPT